MNSSIVIALPKIDDAKKIRTILNRHGFPVAAVCSTASTALASMSELDGGVLICGYKLPDRYYREVLEDIPSYYKKKQKDMGKLVRALTGSKEKVIAENQIYVVLKKLGMSQKSFSSIASAYVFYYMFSSMNEDLWMEVLNGRGLTREN